MMAPRAPQHSARGSWSQRLLVTAIFGAVVLVGWFSYRRGELAAGHDAPAGERARQELADTADRLAAENERLNAKVAELEMARRLDREAYSQIEQTLGDLQAELVRQRDDLAFYRGIVAPADGVQGLRIQRLEVSPGAEPGEYRLKLTLIQAMRHEASVSGLVQVALLGRRAGRPVQYTLDELAGRPRAQWPFSFRYFQTLEQRVTLPPGFEPFETRVEVRSNRLVAPLVQAFPWKVGPAPALSTDHQGG